MSERPLAFLGAGKMATALARGFVAGGRVEPGGIVAADPSPAALDALLVAVPGARAAERNRDAVKDAGGVVLAVKPQHLTGLLAEIGESLPADALVISIAAGYPLARLEAGLPAGARVVRVMPNTPCLVGQGVCGYATGKHATQDDAQKTARLLGSVGGVHELPEPLLDAVTGLSGSGPAFVYTVIEAMSDAGVRCGLPRAVAADLAARTVAGAARMAIETGDHPALLREAVTSPGGTTAAGLAELDRHGLRNALSEAIAAATQRSIELGRDN